MQFTKRYLTQCILYKKLITRDKEANTCITYQSLNQTISLYLTPIQDKLSIELYGIRSISMLRAYGYLSKPLVLDTYLFFKNELYRIVSVKKYQSHYSYDLEKVEPCVFS